MTNKGYDSQHTNTLLFRGNNYWGHNKRRAALAYSAGTNMMHYHHMGTAAWARTGSCMRPTEAEAAGRLADNIHLHLLASMFPAREHCLSWKCSQHCQIKTQRLLSCLSLSPAAHSLPPSCSTQVPCSACSSKRDVAPAWQNGCILRRGGGLLRRQDQWDMATLRVRWNNC